jgi:transcriptional regulator
MLGAIVGFTVPILRVHGINQLSQNKQACVFAGVQAGLQQSSWPTEQRLVVFMADLPTH